eukprot:TRINITY_DN105789_c0_g1_i1.p1 TRINITY_DN105789_c0_g1~~TRINITY_DN105789_c0_g1_i1.p1  ORF type:complete len:272 (+),score=43.66 TRINITY_DN105789_c0_g1_i1:62-817(+)
MGSGASVADGVGAAMKEVNDEQLKTCLASLDAEALARLKAAVLAAETKTSVPPAETPDGAKKTEEKKESAMSLEQVTKFLGGGTTPEMKISQKGRCHCGAVEFIAEGFLVWSGFCHCKNCARNVGMSPVQLVGVGNDEKDPITFTKGADKIFCYKSGEGPTAITRQHCSICGTILDQGPPSVPLYRNVHPANFHIEDGKSCMLPKEYQPLIHHQYENRTFDWHDELPKWSSFPNVSKRMDNKGNVIEEEAK